MIITSQMKHNSKPCSIQLSKRADDDLYINAVLTTPLFTLKAPKIRISDSERRINISVLARVQR
jgi:hypothetical protein